MKFTEEQKIKLRVLRANYIFSDKIGDAFCSYSADMWRINKNTTSLKHKRPLEDLIIKLHNEAMVVKEEKHKLPLEDLIIKLQNKSSEAQEEAQKHFNALVNFIKSLKIDICILNYCANLEMQSEFREMNNLPFDAPDTDDIYFYGDASEIPEDENYSMYMNDYLLVYIEDEYKNKEYNEKFCIGVVNRSNENRNELPDENPWNDWNNEEFGDHLMNE
jgi:hypothetical protein